VKFPAFLFYERKIMISRIKDLINWSKEPEGYIDIVFCGVCGNPRCSLEWQKGKITTCRRCSSNRVTGGSVSKLLQIKMIIRYIVKGY
jgi:hypothetical protein